MRLKPEGILDHIKDWIFIHFFTGGVLRHEGSFHNGLAHVIQIVERKPD